MERKELIELFRALDSKLSSTYEVILVGGAARKVLIRIVDHVAGFRLDWAQKMRYFLMEQGWEID